MSTGCFHSSASILKFPLQSTMNTTEEHQTESRRPICGCCSKRALIIGSSILAISFVTVYMTMPRWLGYVWGGDAESTPLADKITTDRSTVPGIDHKRQRMVGKWTMTSKNSLRTMTLHNDGSGLLIYEPTTFLYKMALGKRVEVDLAWSKSGDYVQFESLQGRPAAAFKLAIKIEGKLKSRRLGSIDDEKMVLMNELINEKDKENNPTSIWYRVRD